MRDGTRREAARQHVEVAAPREHVDRVDVHEAAVVVAHVDDDALLRVILGVEIECSCASACADMSNMCT